MYKIVPPSETLRYFRSSPLTGLPNRCFSDFANASSKFLAPLGTSDMSRTLSEISKWGDSKNRELYGII